MVVPELVVPASLVVVVQATEDTGKMVVFPRVRGPVVHAPPFDAVKPARVIEWIGAGGACEIVAVHRRGR